MNNYDKGNEYYFEVVRSNLTISLLIGNGVDAETSGYLKLNLQDKDLVLRNCNILKIIH